jgi:putative ABC transport system substrate-binding protein
MVGVGDPVGAGFISSLGRPGGNITGVSNISTDLSGKVLAYLLAIVPDAKRVGMLRNPGNPVAKLQLSESERAAQALGVQLLLFDARQPGDLDAALERMARERVAGFVALADPMFISQRSRIAELAMRLRLPSAFARKENVDVGGLISYGPDLADQFFRAAYYVHRILQGTLPSALPVEEPAKLVLAVNLKTAATLGVTVPRITLLAADVVIQ